MGVGASVDMLEDNDDSSTSSFTNVIGATVLGAVVGDTVGINEGFGVDGDCDGDEVGVGHVVMLLLLLL